MIREAEVARLAMQISNARRTAEALGFTMAAHLLTMARLEVDLSELASLTPQPAYDQKNTNASNFEK